MRILVLFGLSLIFIATIASHAKAGAPISFIGYQNRSTPIFSKAGPTLINYQLYAQYDGVHKPGGGLNDEGLVAIVVRDSKNNLLYSYVPKVSPASFGNGTTELGPYVAARGSFQFSNPSSQTITIEEQIWWTRPEELLAGFASQEWGEARGKSRVSGGDNPIVPTPVPRPPTAPPLPPAVTRTSIHAVIISGRSDPAKVITSPNITLTGGVVALGRTSSPPSAAATAWSSGLRIIPDDALLTGKKIPPITPNIIDVRIVKHEVVGDVVAPGSSP
jgi:hypothetical protein